MSLTLGQLRVALRAVRHARDHAIDNVDREEFRTLERVIEQDINAMAAAGRAQSRAMAGGRR